MQPRKSIQIAPQVSISYRHDGRVPAKIWIPFREAGGIYPPPLVFVHAFPLSSAMWHAQSEEFSPDYEVFAPDFRGIGKTSNFTDKPSLQVLAGDLALWLEKIEIYGPITLIGLSMGGYVALEFARQFPHFLGALILCDTRADADSNDVKKARNEMISFAKSNAGRAVAQKMLPRLLGETTRRENPRIPQKIKEIAAPNDGENLAQLLAAMRDRRDSSEILSQIAVPTLVLGGSEDVVSTPEVMAQMAAKIPHARHVVIEGAGHLSNLEKPADFNREVRAFLNRTS